MLSSQHRKKRYHWIMFAMERFPRGKLVTRCRSVVGPERNQDRSKRGRHKLFLLPVDGIPRWSLWAPLLNTKAGRKHPGLDNGPRSKCRKPEHHVTSLSTLYNTYLSYLPPLHHACTIRFVGGQIDLDSFYGDSDEPIGKVQTILRHLDRPFSGHFLECFVFSFCDDDT